MVDTGFRKKKERVMLFRHNHRVVGNHAPGIEKKKHGNDIDVKIRLGSHPFSMVSEIFCSDFHAVIVKDRRTTGGIRKQVYGATRSLRAKQRLHTASIT